MKDQELDDQPRRRGVSTSLRTARTAFDLVASAAKRELVLALVLTLVGGVLTAGELLVGRHLVTLLVDNGDSPSTIATTPSDLAPWLIALSILLVGTALVNAAVGELRTLLNELVHQQAMDQLLEAAATAELEQFEDPEFHDRVQRAREHADQYAWQVVWGLVTLSTTAVSAIVIGIVLFMVAPLLVPVALLAYVPIVLVSVHNTRATYRLHYHLAEMDRDRTYHERLLTGRVEAKEIRAFGLAPWLRKRHADLFDERILNTRRVVARRTTLTLVGSTITALVLVAALAAVMLLALDDRISLAAAAVAVVALQQLAGRLRSIGDALTSMIEGVAFLRDFETFRKRQPVRTETAATPVTLPPNQPVTVTLEHVGYRYPTGIGDALVDISLKLERHRVVAVVGPNGAGKSTLAKLLCGLVAPTSGRIRWDDTDIALCDPVSVRALVAPVFQDFTRYEHTANEAIGFGDVARIGDTEGIREAAERAGADEFIADLPRGYETRLSTAFPAGADLSVGQWQRVAIARAFFRDAPLVVMDEPAASLDPRAELDLFERLHDLGRDRMVLFISHRFATVRRADHIMLLLEGRIAEQGTHDELMSLNGVYAELYTLQSDQFA